MGLGIRRIATRFALLLALSAVVPLLAYGVVSIRSLQRGTRTSVIEGNENVVTRAAEEVRRYITTNADLLKALKAAPSALHAWEALSFTHQREHVEAIEGAKKPETRARRIANAIAFLANRPARPARPVRPARKTR